MKTSYQFGWKSPYLRPRISASRFKRRSEYRTRLYATIRTSRSYKNCSADGPDSNRARAPLKREQLRFAFDMYALGQNFLRLIKMFELEHGPKSLDPYTRKYLKLLACRLLDGLNLSEDETALGLPRATFLEIKYSTIAEATTDLRKLTGQYTLPLVIPELDYHAANTIQTSSLSSTPFTDRLRTLISHPMLRRLAGVSQLGFISLVYPTATHSRFEHVSAHLRMCFVIATLSTMMPLIRFSSR